MPASSVHGVFEFGLVVSTPSFQSHELSNPPNTRNTYVSVKTVEQQAIVSMHRARQGFIKARTAQSNQIRGLLSEFGIVIPQGI